MFIPTRPNRPSIAKKSNCLPVTTSPATTPIKIIGTISRITIGFLYARNSSSSVMKIRMNVSGILAASAAFDSSCDCSSPKTCIRYPSGRLIFSRTCFNTSVKAALVLAPRTGSHWAIITRSRL